MNSLITQKDITSKEKIQRIPWRYYLKKQSLKIIGFIIVAIMIILCKYLSIDLNPTTVSFNDPKYIFVIILSSICFLSVLIGFSKIILFDMSKEFGLSDEKTGRMNYNFRFFLFAALALSFCSAIYLLLDVFLPKTYLQILPVLIIQWVIITFQIEIHGLSDLTNPREFYQTARNIYFDFFFLVILFFSIIVSLSILTSYGRTKLIHRFKKANGKVNEEEENKSFYKILIWILIPPSITFILIPLLNTSVNSIIILIILLMAIWWLYQLLKTIFRIIWRGVKLTAFLTSVNALLLIPLFFVLWGLPVILWTGWDVIEALKQELIQINIINLIQFSFERFPYRLFDFIGIMELDFVLITTVATFIVGFAEGFALLAIASALFRGVEIARTGQIIVKSPPRIIVMSKYFFMLCLYLGMWWNSLISLWTMLIEELNISLPPIPIPSVVYLLYNNVILPLSDILEKVFPSLLFLSSIPYLILPLYFILAGAFKFLSVTIITPRIKYRLSYFFLLISTAFVLILTNLLGEIYKIGFEDAPFRLVENIIVLAVNVFDYVESLAFYCGFLFGIVWVLRYMSKKGKEEQIVSPKSTLNGDKPYSLENNINKETNTIKRSSEIDIEDIKSSDE